MKRAANEKTSSDEIGMIKRTKIERGYATMIVYLSGDDDYGALNAKNYGEDEIIDAILKGKDPSLNEDFNFSFKVFFYESENARSTAMTMMNGVISHVGDYDRMKHDDVICRALTEEECETYIKQLNKYDV